MLVIDSVGGIFQAMRDEEDMYLRESKTGKVRDSELAQARAMAIRNLRIYLESSNLGRMRHVRLIK